MYRKHKFLLILVWAISMGLCNWQKIDFEVDLISTMLTVLSITFGLTITAITSLFGTSYVQKMSHTIDIKTGIKQTGLQVIRNYFKYSCSLNLCSIICMLFVLAFRSSISTLPTWIIIEINALVLSGVVCCLVLSSLLVRLLLNALISKDTN